MSQKLIFRIKNPPMFIKVKNQFIINEKIRLKANRKRKKQNNNRQKTKYKQRNKRVKRKRANLRILGTKIKKYNTKNKQHSNRAHVNNK
jgi:hypothetical protein